MFERLETPRELFTYKLGSALKMENTVLDMLGDFTEEATRSELKRLFSHHADETQQQIRNIETAFSQLGEEPDEKPCPAIEGLEKEGKVNVKKAEDALVDVVILAGAAETEHHEIAVYETLITYAQALGEEQLVPLLQQNLQQEQHTLEEVKQATRNVAQQTPRVPA